jgi:multicomponent Na+:H+ antiporter subunit D
MLLAIFVKVFYSAFLGPALPKMENVKEVPKSMLIAMGILSVIIFFFGIFPDLVISNIVEPAANALINHSDYINTILSFGGV